MKELIKITEHNGLRAVSARELHQFLEVKSKFADWIKNRIDEYGFIENQDFVSVSKILENGGRSKEYAISIDMAKELSMVERNEKGKQARKYFIECEKQLKVGGFALPQTFAEALKLAAQQAERLELQQAELQIQAPKVAYYDEVLQSQSTYNTNQIAKELGMAAITLNKKLQEMKVQYKQNGCWLLYHKHQNKGYTKTKTHTYTDSNGQTQTSMQMVWTEEGRRFIHHLFGNQLKIA